MMPVSHRVDATAARSALPVARRSPNSSTLAIGVATTFALLSAVLSLACGSSDHPDAVGLELRGTLSAMSDTTPAPLAPPVSRGAR